MHRSYETEEITVFWNSERCRHAKECVSGSPEVFEFGRRPWIDLSHGESAKIWQTISRCPSGALGITYNHEVKVSYDESGCRAVAILNGEEIGECDYEIIQRSSSPASTGSSLNTGTPAGMPATADTSTPEDNSGNLCWNIYHTHVLPEHNGKNIAKRLVYCLLEAAERRGITVIASCSYAAKALTS